MAVVKINAIQPNPGMEQELERRFADRAGEVEKVEGFVSFQLLRPVSGETRYFVVTTWESDEAFMNWVTSPAFMKGHAQMRDTADVPTAHASDLLAFEVVQEVTAERVAELDA